MNCLPYFKTLADETRLRLLHLLFHHELNVNEIVSVMNMGQSRISRHLKISTEAGLLSCRRDGAWAFYSIIKNGPGRKLMEAVGFLFESDPVFSQDLARAQTLLEERKLRSRDFFNAIAEDWNHLQREILGDFDLHQTIAQNIGQPLLAVDLGCGTGELLKVLGKKARRTIGIDNSRKMLDQAQKLAQTSENAVELRLGELEHLPVGNAEADCAVLSLVMHHLDEPAKVVTETARILKPGGTLIIADFDKHTREEMRHSHGDRWLGFSSTEINQLLSQNGFSVSRTKTFQLKQSIQLNITIATKISS